MSASSLKLESPESLIAAIPAVFGFTPEESLVLITVSDGQMGPMMRADLDPVLEASRSNVLATALETMTHGIVTCGAEQVIAVIITGSTTEEDEHRALTLALDFLLAERNVDLVATHTVDRISVGGRWYCTCGCGKGGVIDNPNASLVAMAAVLEGRRVNATRNELVAMIAPSAVVDVDDVGVTDWTVSDKVEYGLAAITSDAAWDYSVMAHVIADITARDVLMSLALTDIRDEAESMWLDLARRLPAPYRVPALTLFAYSMYCRGDGTLAGIALLTATNMDPDYQLAGLMDSALRAGLTPKRICELSKVGYRLGVARGVNMPEQVLA